MSAEEYTFAPLVSAVTSGRRAEMETDCNLTVVNKPDLIWDSSLLRRSFYRFRPSTTAAQKADYKERFLLYTAALAAGAPCRLPDPGGIVLTAGRSRNADGQPIHVYNLVEEVALVEVLNSQPADAPDQKAAVEQAMDKGIEYALSVKSAMTSPLGARRWVVAPAPYWGILVPDPDLQGEMPAIIGGRKESAHRGWQYDERDRLHEEMRSLIEYYIYVHVIDLLALLMCGEVIHASEPTRRHSPTLGLQRDYELAVRDVVVDPERLRQARDAHAQTGRRHRLHDVRGFLRRRPGEEVPTVWVRAHRRGDARLGVVLRGETIIAES